LICFFFDKYQKQIFGDFQIGLELIIINGLLVFLGLLAVSKPQDSQWSMDAERTEGPSFATEKK
jgi:hypothetical protein